LYKILKHGSNSRAKNHLGRIPRYGIRRAVKEFWLIDPQNKTVEIYTMDNNTYRLHEFQEQEGKITSLVLEGFEMEVASIFEL
jgi:Uma2 family endonuclease